MAEGDEYLDYRDETLEQTAKPWNILLGAFLKMETQTTCLGTFQKNFRRLPSFSWSMMAVLEVGLQTGTDDTVMKEEEWRFHAS